ncbi:unnamed protein product [Prunus armeniaca]
MASANAHCCINLLPLALVIFILFNAVHPCLSFNSQPDRESTKSATKWRSMNSATNLHPKHKNSISGLCSVDPSSPRPDNTECSKHT